MSAWRQSQSLGHQFIRKTVVAKLVQKLPAGTGFVCLSGSHKRNFELPDSVSIHDGPPTVVNVPVQAGDCVIFTEALTHGTLPWKAKHQRRALLYKFSPGYQAFSGGAHEKLFPDYILDMTEEQRAVMEPPYCRR